MVLGQDTTTFGYDNNGNMTSMVAPGPVTTTYGYDLENRLTGVTNPSYTASYAYSNDGLRLRAQESNHAYPDRWFLYDGVRPVSEGTLSGDTFTTNNRYAWEGDSYYSALVSASIGGSDRHFLYDGLGSTRQLLDESQAVTDTYQYEAFGNLMGSSGTTPNPYRYVGSLGYYQTGNSLMHLGARYYMPEVGRFAARDPMRAQPPEPHAYAYCDNLVPGAVDPSGKNPVALGWALWKAAWQIGCAGLSLYAAIDTARCVERELDTLDWVDEACAHGRLPDATCELYSNTASRVMQIVETCAPIVCPAAFACSVAAANWVIGRIYFTGEARAF
jgi:RHS repeat-associated protein